MQQQRLINNSSQFNMFRAIILPIFRSTRLCVTACGIIHARCCRPATSCVYYTTSCNTQSSAPEDGQNNCPKLVELTGIINKPLLLHLVRCLYYLYQWCTVKQISENEIYLLIKYIKSVLWRVAKCLSYIDDARCLKVNCFQQFYLNRLNPLRQQLKTFVYVCVTTVVLLSDISRYLRYII